MARVPNKLISSDDPIVDNLIPEAGDIDLPSIPVIETVVIKLDETVVGGKYIKNGVWVNANGVPIETESDEKVTE